MNRPQTHDWQPTTELRLYGSVLQQRWRKQRVDVVFPVSGSGHATQVWTEHEWRDVPYVKPG